MSVSEPTPKVEGIVVTSREGKIISALGKGQDPRIKALASDLEWIRNALRRRMVPILLTDQTLTGIARQIEGGYLLLLSAGPTDTVLQFLLNVDFAYNIIDNILTDPYDAMVVVDAEERVAFISPVHEEFFGLGQGEAVGKPVQKVIENTRLHHVVRTGVAEVGQIQHMKGSERVVTRHPIRRDGKVVGAIGRIMFKGPQQLEAMSRRINDLEQEIATYKKEAEEEKRGEEFLEAIIGQSLAIRSVREQIRKVAPLDVPVLIQGESGTGKELVARALHMLSPRREGRLVNVNAAALPANLVESELFGYEPGSFTGADRKGRAGKFELADKGTIFLDEIGDMPLEVQSKLLRILQDNVVERVGSDKPRHVDFRLCSATNRDLDQFVEQDRFRLDLYYRISPVRIVVPSLDERLEDIPLLLRHFIKEMSDKYARPEPEVDIDLPDYLMSRSWPGNVRQLRHMVERAFVFAESGRLRVADFLTDGGPAPRVHAEMLEEPVPAPANQDSKTLKDAIDRLEQNLITEAMMQFNGNKKKVAAHLGISRSYLYKKLGE